MGSERKEDCNFNPENARGRNDLYAISRDVAIAKANGEDVTSLMAEAAHASKEIK